MVKYEELSEESKRIITKVEKRYRKSSTMTDSDMVLIGLFIFQRYHYDK